MTDLSAAGSAVAAVPRVLVVGDVINDVVVRPLSAVTADSDTRAEIVRRPGGSAANLACWLAGLGTPVGFIGRVGRADHAYHLDHLTGFGVEALLVGDAERETGTIVIVVDRAGARTMFTDRGANLGLTLRDVPIGELARASVLHLTGYSYFEDGVRATALELDRRARETGTTVSIDPSSAAFLEEVGPEQFLAWTSGARLCFPNRDEAAVLSGTTDPVEGAARLTCHYATVVVTLDGEGAVVAERGRPPVTVPAERVRALDTTGAGDAFCAGFLDSWLRRPDPVAAAAAGARVAQHAVVRLGGGPPAPVTSRSSTPRSSP
ncbi:putative sugar kinase YdjH [mine drainage metagenome]|uniref:Putative sugar kinase YdjH n=1 Tax=mine drainage metagenome TaxID=410659 RepID=A0A1J5R4V8_9ZZZZ